MQNEMNIDNLTNIKEKIDAIITATNLTMLVEPNVTITFIEAKARLMEASKKFAKIIALMEKNNDSHNA